VRAIGNLFVRVDGAGAAAAVKLIGPARHYVMLDQPALTSAAVLEFLRHVWG